ncbi:thioltransferase, partial [Ramicandelaber brevisporus]
AAVAKKVDQLIADNNIVVFSKSWCPYCSKAKAALTKAKQKFEAIELDLIPDGAAIQAYLLAKTGQRTVPSIFINQKHIGGCDNLLSGLASGKI